MFSHLFTVLLLLAFVSAAPLSSEKRQDGVQVINNCYVDGQVALTFDGEYERVVSLSPGRWHIGQPGERDRLLPTTPPLFMSTVPPAVTTPYITSR